MARTGNGTSTVHAKLEDRYLERVQVGATLVFHDLVRAGPPLAEIALELLGIATVGRRIPTELIHVNLHTILRRSPGRQSAVFDPCVARPLTVR